jgi:hypothetical protein
VDEAINGTLRGSSIDERQRWVPAFGRLYAIHGLSSEWSHGAPGSYGGLRRGATLSQEFGQWRDGATTTVVL